MFKMAECEHILCMNSDAHMGLGWEERLLSFLDNEEYGLVGPMMVRNFILGCCFIIRKTTLNKIGMLNEGFGMGYVDDVELSNRVVRNGLKLGYATYKEDFDGSIYVDFPILHTQGDSFRLLSDEKINNLDCFNTRKFEKFKNEDSEIILIQNWSLDDTRRLLEVDSDSIIVSVMLSGEEFEKVRFDEQVIERIHLFECTTDMDISVISESILSKKKYKVIKSILDMEDKKDKQKVRKTIMRDETNTQGLLDMIDELGDTSDKEMIEIGSFIGESTVIFAKHFKHVLAIDPFLSGYDIDDPTSYMDFNSVYNDFQETVSEEKDKISVLKMKSDEAVAFIDKKYDFIYIDGLHTYDGVRHDIINYLPFIKPGGWIGGHDYTQEIPRLAGVFDAVNEIFGKPDKVFKDNSWIKHIPTESKGNTYPNRKQITWLAKFDDYSSMGILSQRILERLKSDFVCKSIIGQTETNNSIILNSFKTSKKEIGIMFSYPDMHIHLNDFETKVIYTGVDTTGGIPNFTSNINKADFILTPSTRSKINMHNLGAKPPIYVLPHGVDIDLFKYNYRSLFDKFRFLYVGECSDRKGIFQLIEAFLFLFKDNKNVELHIKSNSDMLFYGSDSLLKIKEDNNNIFLHFSNEGHDKVLELYNSCHAYVYPSRADTFGMTLLEAMSCGLPVISTELPGATELIDGRYFKIKHRMVPVEGHPWMLGEWGEADLFSLASNMQIVYKDYQKIIESGELKRNSEYIRDNYSWNKIVDKFETEILPRFVKKTKVITLLTSFNRPKYLKDTLETLKEIKEDLVSNDIYLVENSNFELKKQVLESIRNINDLNICLYDSETNLGQRGSLLQMLEDINLDEYEYIQFTDQDNLFHEKLSTYCEILEQHKDAWFATGYMSKEHQELGWINTKWGNLCEKRSLRAGHMFMRVKDFKKLLPIRLDGQYGQSHNSSWHAGLDWELSYWNKNAPGRITDKNFVLCLPGGVEHVGIDSTMYQWDVLANEYDLETLKSLRYKKSPE